jgi:hypothetical protein
VVAICLKEMIIFYIYNIAYCKINKKTFGAWMHFRSILTISNGKKNQKIDEKKEKRAKEDSNKSKKEVKERK